MYLSFHWYNKKDLANFYVKLAEIDVAQNTTRQAQGRVTHKWMIKSSERQKPTSKHLNATKRRQ
jgi:hypothetical protein